MGSRLPHRTPSHRGLGSSDVQRFVCPVVLSCSGRGTGSHCKMEVLRNREAHVAKGPQTMEEQGVNALNALPSWGFSCLGQLGKSTDGDLEESCWEES